MKLRKIFWSSCKNLDIKCVPKQIIGPVVPQIAGKTDNSIMTPSSPGIAMCDWKTGCGLHYLRTNSSPCSFTFLLFPGVVWSTCGLWRNNVGVFEISLRAFLLSKRQYSCAEALINCSKKSRRPQLNAAEEFAYANMIRCLMTFQ